MLGNALPDFNKYNLIVIEICMQYYLSNLFEPAFFFRGLPFISHLDSLPNFNRSSEGPIRLSIVDKYKVK